ncbi:hypothetical protein GH714_027395 [Hevea brasiliensis]|uniref:Uncharacterized protein n=1 Tax=Hevea brasiliensis TaxID=3981 RepID=A0A6A6MMP8_HEVBR|nr:hypothetical protein GH714_027395 [Hevea brasiliensis]
MARLIDTSTDGSNSSMIRIFNAIGKAAGFQQKTSADIQNITDPQRVGESSGRGSCRRDVARSWLCSEEVQMTETAAEWPGTRRKVTRPDCIFGCWPPRLPDWYHEVLWTLMKGAVVVER